MVAVVDDDDDDVSGSVHEEDRAGRFAQCAARMRWCVGYIMTRCIWLF